MLIAKFFDYEGAFVEAVNVSKMSWTRQKNKEYTFNVELASIPNASDYRILLLDTENLLRVLPSGYVTDYDGEYTLSISSWEQHLGNASKIPENWQWWDRKSLDLAISDHCYGFGKVSYAGLASLQSAFSATHVVISELDDSNGDIYLDTFQYLSQSEIAYYELGSVVYRITVPSEARRPGMY